FTAEYLKCLNATEAAIKAGYSPRCAYVQGARLLRNAKIKGKDQSQSSSRKTRLLTLF
ncbi:MAG: terminase small subunit, partial [Synergistaceae bacterium]|nr:terminase small subunit [Synergistaceae bacterium]